MEFFVLAGALNTAAITGASWFVPYLLGVLSGIVLLIKLKG